ncbi:hypothetical protein TM1040_2098 [Ruegeria sp. TM1040]|uniref:DUF2125 domain-containing protein n=1 Tax=Ruegeria sp. (strain TM1040) TaxID=292414 RepID=UPI0000462F87|nr:DUF2125 domain-containing protein [Ruegeria sp. TM1040]ABF64830.1 hypothetical protein TM1040_2098 [Ruegeria sp. TM1040]
MKRGLKILFGLCVVWSLYWAVAAWGLRQSVAAWFEEQAARGWQVEVKEITAGDGLGGYPWRHVTQITQPALADPGTGAAWRADWLELQSPAIWPGHQSLRFADGDQRLSYYDQTAVITTQGLQADLFLAPGLALELEELGLTSGSWRIGDDAEATLSADDLSLRMVQGSVAESYEISAEARAFRPGKALRRLLRAAPKLPQAFETLSLAMDVTFDKAWDLSVLEHRRPQPRQIDLALLEAHWGEMRLKMSGALEVDEAGIPTGEVALQVEAWAEFLALAEDSGLLSPTLREQASRVVAVMARASGNPEDLDITLGFRNGNITIGPIPLGPAPRLIIR